MAGGTTSPCAKAIRACARRTAEHYRQAYIFEPDQPRWKPWVPDIYARQVEIVDERHGRFVMGYVPKYHELIEIGDRIVLTIRSGSAIRMNDCENVRIEDVTFLAAPGCAYLGRYMRGDNYYRYTIKPGPPPPGATEPRLISTCADGLNIAFATKGPTIEGCRFSFMGDDSVNLHGVTFVGRRAEDAEGTARGLAVFSRIPGDSDSRGSDRAAAASRQLRGAGEGEAECVRSDPRTDSRNIWR